MMRAILALLAVTLWAGPLSAQEATLIADAVRIEADERLVAEGNVQVGYEGAVLTAPRVVYDRAADRLLIDGPIRLTENDRTLVLADRAALDADLENGILRSARLVLDRQLQIAATQMARVGGRYVQLTNTVASSCEICDGGPPTWEIRARRVIHDRQERLIYFDRATFRIFGLPVAYFPRLTLPDPSRTRKTGLLIPRLASNSRLGLGIKAPVFVTLGEHADLTLTPYVSSLTRTLEARYRQTLSFGALNIRGAVSRDDLVPDELRWYVFGRGAFVLPLDYQLDINVESVSDDAYIFDYDYDYQDRLVNEIRLSKVERNLLIRGRLSGYETLRGAERRIRDILPSEVSDVVVEKRLPLGPGEMRLGFDAGTIYRTSDEDGLGRDVRTFGGSIAYLDRRVSARGLVLSNEARFGAQVYRTRQDSSFDAGTGRLTAALSTTLRLPLQKTGRGGAMHLIEPVVALAWLDQSAAEVPNEDSVLVEFDEGNLLALSHFSGNDLAETGFRGTVGLNYTGRFQGGNRIDLTLGRIYRSERQADFSLGSGLSGHRSDWLVASRIGLGSRVDLIGRALFDDTLEARKSEARITYRQSGFDIGGSFSWIDADPVENRPDDIAEVRVFSGLSLGRHWSTGLSGRYDFTGSDATQAGLTLRYRTECLNARLSLSQRFTDTETIRPKTTFGFIVELAGFGDDPSNQAYRRTCNG